MGDIKLICTYTQGASKNVQAPNHLLCNFIDKTYS